MQVWLDWLAWLERLPVVGAALRVPVAQRFFRSRSIIEKLSYLFFGALTTAIDFFIFFLLNSGFGITYWIATPVAWVLAVVFAFVTNKLYVFGSRRFDAATLLRESSSFFAARSVSFLFNYGWMILAVEKIGLGETAAKLLSVIVVIVMNYIFSKLFIFRTPGGGSGSGSDSGNSGSGSSGNNSGNSGSGNPGGDSSGNGSGNSSGSGNSNNNGSGNGNSNGSGNSSSSSGSGNPGGDSSDLQSPSRKGAAQSRWGSAEDGDNAIGSPSQPATDPDAASQPTAHAATTTSQPTANPDAVGQPAAYAATATSQPTAGPDSANYTTNDSAAPDPNSADYAATAATARTPTPAPPGSLMSFLRRRRLELLSFFVPAALLCVAFVAVGISPFGDGSMLIVDNYHQYTPFIMEFGEMLRDGRSLMHSWNAGLGSNFLARYSYYLSSPLNFLSIFVPRSGAVGFVLALTIARAGGAGLAFFIYLREKHGRGGVGAPAIAFAAMYALCAYFLAYYWNIMWFDCIAILPIVALGIERIADRGRARTYIIALGLTVLSNFFIAIMVCIFSVLYFIAYTLSKKRPGVSMRAYAGRAALFAGGSGLAGALSAIVTLPAFYGLLLSSAANAKPPTAATIYSDVLDILSNHLTMIKPSIMVGLPNIYCGMAAFFLVPAYFANRRIDAREKICNGLLLAFFILSFNINYLDFYWHGTHFPNSLLFRFAFIYVFLLLAAAYKALANIGGVARGFLPGCLAATSAFIFYMEAQPTEKLTKLSVYISFAWALALCGALTLVRQAREQARLRHSLPWREFLLFALVAAEIGVNAGYGIGEAGVLSQDNYASRLNEAIPAVEWAKAQETGFERIEFTEHTTYNTPVVYGYKGVSYYSSTSNVAVNNLFGKLGLIHSSAWYVYRSAPPTLDAMLSVKYLLDKNSGEGSSDDRYDNGIFPLARQVGGVGVFKNPYWLPVGFIVSEGLRDWDAGGGGGDPFRAQEDFFAKATGGMSRPLFVPLRLDEEELANVAVSGGADGSYRFSRVSEGKPMKATFSAAAPFSGPVYFYAKSSKVERATVHNGAKSQTHNIKYPYIMDAQYVGAGRRATVDIDFESSDGDSFTLLAYAFDETAFQAAHRMLAGGGLDVELYSDTHVAGNVDARDGGLLFLSIPFSDDWSATVDGAPAKIEGIGGDALMAIQVGPGRHDVELRFRTRGLVAGAAVSLAALAALLLAPLAARRLSRLGAAANPAG